MIEVRNFNLGEELSETHSYSKYPFIQLTNIEWKKCTERYWEHSKTSSVESAARPVLHCDGPQWTFPANEEDKIILRLEQKWRKNEWRLWNIIPRRPVVFYWQLFQLDSLSEFGAANLQDKKLEVLNQEMREEPDRFDRIQNCDL